MKEVLSATRMDMVRNNAEIGRYRAIRQFHNIEQILHKGVTFDIKLEMANKQYAQLTAQLENDDQFQEGELTFTQFILLKQSSGKFSNIILRHVILLDNQSNMYLICNKRLVRNICTIHEKQRLLSNGGSPTVSQIADINKYTQPV